MGLAPKLRLVKELKEGEPDPWLTVSACVSVGKAMNTFRTVEREGKLPVVHVAGRHAIALCPACAHPSATTNGTGWREVIDVVRTLVVVLSLCVRRFVCENPDCVQRTFDERFEGIGPDFGGSIA